MLVCYFILIVCGIQHAFANPLASVPVEPRQQPTPTLVSTAETQHVINNSYIVILKPGIDSQSLLTHLDFLQFVEARSPLANEVDGDVKHVYDGPKMKGYAGVFSDITLEHIRGQPEVEYIEQDQLVWASSRELQRSAPWGLARISHRDRFPTVTTYYYDSSAGGGVDVYVIDTGVNINHVEFQGRARWGKTMPENDRDEDNNGHGTHCAGTIASRKYGVAKKANIISVKVLRSNGSGTMADVLGGIIWASNEAARNAARARAEYATTGYTTHRGSVANMSLGGGKSRALEDAVNAAVEHGMHFAVAAGNDFGDACESSPAAAKNAITVGASTRDDERADFSNSGKCVDLFAPGLNILSTWIGTNYATNIISGTSMASPHTAGMVAYLLSLYSSNGTSASGLQQPIPMSSLPSAITNEYPFIGLATVLSALKRIMPRWITDPLSGTYQAKPFVDTYQGGFDIAAVPGTLSPLQMKKLVVGMATADALTDLPSDTPNLLIFNGAGTLPSSHAVT